MKTKQFLVVLTITTGSLFLDSCKKNSDGGEAEVHALIYHGDVPIVGTTTLFVKFDSKAQPADPSNNYDMKVDGDPDDNHVHVEGLRPGNYFLYAEAFDSAAMKPVRGGTPVTVKWSERKQTKEVGIQTN